jgi:hypothetical protein
VLGREKRSRSVRMDHSSLDIQREIPVRHSVYLRIIDARRRRRRKARVTHSRTSAETFSTGVWRSSILPDRSIYIRWGMLKFESSCRAVLSLRHDISGTPNRENHLPVFGWSMESSSSGATPDRDSIEDYPEVRGSAY